MGKVTLVLTINEALHVKSMLDECRERMGKRRSIPKGISLQGMVDRQNVAKKVTSLIESQCGIDIGPRVAAAPLDAATKPRQAVAGEAR